MQKWRMKTWEHLSHECYKQSKLDGGRAWNKARTTQLYMAVRAHLSLLLLLLLLQLLVLLKDGKELLPLLLSSSLLLLNSFNCSRFQITQQSHSMLHCLH